MTCVGAILRRKYKTAVVTVYHDDRTDHTGRHTPGSLMYILKCIVLICKLYAIMPLQSRHRSCGWYRTATLFRHASETRSYRLPLHRQIFLCLSSVRGQPGLPVLPRRNQRTHSASGWCVPLPLLPLHVRYGPPATKTLWSAGTDGSSSPSA